MKAPYSIAVSYGWCERSCTFRVYGQQHQKCACRDGIVFEILVNIRATVCCCVEKALTFMLAKASEVLCSLVVQVAEMYFKQALTSKTGKVDDEE